MAYLIVGCPQIDSNSSGFAIVYKYDHGIWSSHGDVLTGMENGEKPTNSGFILICT